MDYSKIFHHSWEIVKKNRPLWVFGMVLAAYTGAGFGSGGGGSNFKIPNSSNIPGLAKPTPSPIPSLFPNPATRLQNNLPFTSSQNLAQVLGANISRAGHTLSETVSDPASYFRQMFFSIPLSFWIVLILGIILSSVFFLILRIFLLNWATAAIYKSVYQLESSNKPVTLAAGSNFGRGVWKKLFLASLALWGSFMLALIVSVIITVILVIISPVLGIVFVIPFFLLFIIASFLLTVWNTYAQLAISLEDYPLKKSLSFSWQMVKKFFWQGMVLGFFHQLFGLIYGCLSCLAVVVFLGLVAGICYLAVLLNMYFGIFTTVILGSLALITLGFLILITGIFKAFTTSNWVLFYLELKNDPRFPGSPPPPPPAPVEYLAQTNQSLNNPPEPNPDPPVPSGTQS